MRRIVAALIPFALTAALAFPVAAQTVTMSPGIITIEGIGEVVGPPRHRDRHLRRHLAGRDRPRGAQRQHRRHGQTASRR